MKTSFKKQNGAAPFGAAAATLEQPAPGALAPLVDETGETTSLAFPSKAVDGEFLPGDFLIPRLHLVQAVGGLSEKFPPGSFVYAKEQVLSDGSVPIILTVLRIKKQYIENVPYGSEELPRVFDTLEEVKEAGGWIDWRDDERPPFGPVLQTVVVIRSPTKDNPLFPYEQGGAAYGLAIWSLRSTGFNRAGKAIITASQFALKEGLHTGSWLLTSRREKIGPNFVYVPVLRHDARNSEEFCRFAQGLLS